MTCETLFEINTLIFDEFFRNDNDLSNLYSFLVIDNNQFCIDITTNDFLTNSTLNANVFFYRPFQGFRPGFRPIVSRWRLERMLKLQEAVSR